MDTTNVGLVPVRDRAGTYLFALVDADDLPLIAEYKWYALHTHKKTYALGYRAGQRVLMHRLIARTPLGMLTDHINGKVLDNRKANLRHATTAQNTAYAPRRSSSVHSPFKGAHPSGKKWQARIRRGGKYAHLGMFGTAEEAARAYDRAARALHGQFAYTNFQEAA